MVLSLQMYPALPVLTMNAWSSYWPWMFQGRRRTQTVRFLTVTFSAMNLRANQYCLDKDFHLFLISTVVFGESYRYGRWRGIKKKEKKLLKRKKICLCESKQWPLITQPANVTAQPLGWWKACRVTILPSAWNDWLFQCPCEWAY